MRRSVTSEETGLGDVKLEAAHHFNSEWSVGSGGSWIGYSFMNWVEMEDGGSSREICAHI